MTRRLPAKFCPPLWWWENQGYWFLTQQTYFSTHLNPKINPRIYKNQSSNPISPKKDSNHKIKPDKFSYPQLKSVFLDNIKVENNHYKTHLTEWNPLIPISTILVVEIGVNNNFFSLRQSPTILSLYSHKKGPEN